MKLILSSFGFTTDTMEEEVAKIVGKPASEINIAIINESSYVIDRNKSKRWLIEEFANIAKHIGGRIDFIDFYMQSMDDIKERMFNADLIYITGGKKQIYSGLFKKLNMVDLLKEVAESRVIMGTSAGSMVLGTQIQSEKFWNERYHCKFEDIKNQDLGFVPFNIVPHHMREDHKAWPDEFLARVLEDNPFPVYAITDEQAVAYIDGEIIFIGGEPKIFGNKA